MPGTVLTNCKILMGGYNLSGYHNQISLTISPEMLDDTRFGVAGTRSFRPGLKQVEATGNVFWDDDIDGVLFNRIGASREVLSVAEVGETVGDRVFIVRAVNGTYNPLSGEVGALVQSELNFRSANTPAVRGALLATGSKAVSGTGTGVLVGLLGTGQKAYSALHVTAIAATSIIVQVESDDAIGFPSPTLRMTHTTFLGAGTVGADWQELVGPVATDTYWRSKWTIVGGPFTIFHSFGIL